MSNYKCPQCGNTYSSAYCSQCEANLSPNNKVESALQEKKYVCNTGFLSVMCFLAPLFAFIIGAIYISSTEYDRIMLGKRCVIIGLISTVIVLIVAAILYFSLYSQIQSITL